MADMLTVTVGTTDYTFDWIAQEIHIESGVTEVMAADLKTAIHDAQDDEVGVPFDPIADFFNPVTLTATASTFLNVVLRDQWRIDSLASSGTLTVGDGNVVNANNGIDIFSPLRAAGDCVARSGWSIVNVVGLVVSYFFIAVGIICIIFKVMDTVAGEGKITGVVGPDGPEAIIPNTIMDGTFARVGDVIRIHDGEIKFGLGIDIIFSARAVNRLSMMLSGYRGYC